MKIKNPFTFSDEFVLLNNEVFAIPENKDSVAFWAEKLNDAFALGASEQAAKHISWKLPFVRFMRFMTCMTSSQKEPQKIWQPKPLKRSKTT